MNILKWFISSRRDARIRELAKQLAKDQRSSVSQQLAPRSGSLQSVPEACGYIRTRAFPILRCGLARTIARDVELSPSVHPQIIEHAMEILLGDFVGAMVAPVPVVKRRAA